MTDSHDETPYDELDPPIVNLCMTINAMPGIWTSGSCGGHPKGEGLLPEDEWLVIFGCEVDDDERPTRDAWLSLEFAAWAIHDIGRGATVGLRVSSPPPWMNEPARSIYFALEGRRGADGIEPDAVAELLTTWAAPFLEDDR